MEKLTKMTTGFHRALPITADDLKANILDRFKRIKRIEIDREPGDKGQKTVTFWVDNVDPQEVLDFILEYCVDTDYIRTKEGLQESEQAENITITPGYTTPEDFERWMKEAHNTPSLIKILERNKDKVLKLIQPEKEAKPMSQQDQEIKKAVQGMEYFLKQVLDKTDQLRQELEAEKQKNIKLAEDCNKKVSDLKLLVDGLSKLLGQPAQQGQAQPAGIVQRLDGIEKHLKAIPKFSG